MERKLRQHIESLFSSAPNTQQANELKEEIIRNTIERYHDLLAEGKSESEAYNLALAGIGDINELLVALGGSEIAEAAYPPEQVRASRNRITTLRAIAIGLYILCVTPVILLSETPLVNISPIFMFFMISAATGLLIYSSITKYVELEQSQVIAAKIKKSAFMKAIAIGLFISCVTPCILFADTPLETASVALMFLMIAAGVVLLIFSKGSKSTVNKKDVKIASSSVPEKKSPPLYRVLVAVLWVVASTAFILIIVSAAFFNGAIVSAAALSWLVFPLAASLQGLMRAIFDYVEASE